MRKFLVLILTCFMLCSCVSNGSDSTSDRLVTMKKASVVPVVNKKTENDNLYKPLNYDTQKAIWLSYIDLAPMLTGKSESEFTDNFSYAVQQISELDCNTIYVHVRPFGDALYGSKLYPTSQYISGQVGDNADFDPLEIMCEIAHEYDLSLHAWINPLRLETESNFSFISSDYKIKEWYESDDKSDYVQNVSGDEHLWLNPAYEEVRTLIADGCRELAQNYEIDGIHYDDYFYPTTDENFDAECYGNLSENISLSQWRLENISQMVKEIYSSVKSVNKDIVVGTSPQGNIENNYAYMYADVKKWCSEDGYIDYIAPQIYYGYNNSVKPYAQTLETWKGLCTNENIKLVIGLAVYKIGVENEFTDNVGTIGEQIKDAYDNGCGVALYAYNSIFTPSSDLAQRIEAEKQTIENVL